MQKVVSINLGGSVFQVDEDAYDLLRNYIETIRLHFKGTEGGLEISNDIEQRLAEMFQARVASNANLINRQMVEEVMALMGKPSDFETGEQTSTSSQSQASTFAEPGIKRKLFRDPDNRMLGGVCAGFGAYLGIGRWIFRVLVLALILLPFSKGIAGGIILIYIILWIAIPKAKSVTDRMEMKGEPINLSGFEKNFRSTFGTESQKPFTRDITNKMIGGVASGIANYFGAQIWVIRAMFLVALLFFGTGLLLYVILWIAVPKSSLPDEQNSSIYESAKINLSKSAGPLGGFFAKLIGFIEEVFKMVIRFVSRISGFVLFIIMIILLGIAAAFSSSVSPYWYILFNEYNDFVFTRIAAWIVIGIPLALGLLLALYLLGRKIKISGFVGLTLFFAWIVAAGFGAFYGFKLNREFMVEKKNSQKITLSPTGGLLDIMSSGEAFPSGNFYFDDAHGFAMGGFAVMDSGIYSKWVELKIVPADSAEAELYYNVSAFGKDTLIAAQNQKLISYNLSQSNNDLILSPYFKIPSKSKWRAQRIEMLLKLPTGYKIRLNEGAASQLHIEGLPSYKRYDDDGDYDYVFDRVEALHLVGKTLEMTKEGLKCTDC